jgi:hypothetical protein
MRLTDFWQRMTEHFDVWRAVCVAVEVPEHRR